MCGEGVEDFGAFVVHKRNAHWAPSLIETVVRVDKPRPSARAEFLDVVLELVDASSGQRGVELEWLPMQIERDLSLRCSKLNTALADPAPRSENITDDRDGDNGASDGSSHPIPVLLILWP